MYNILFVCKGSLDKAVPIINIARSFNNSGCLIEMFCENVSPSLEYLLISENIKVYKIKTNNFFNFKLFSKILNLYNFRIAAKRKIRNSSFDFLYIGTGDTAIVLKGIFEKRYKYFLHLRELYDQLPHYMSLLRNPAQNAYKVIVPEENRAFLYYIFLKLSKVPIVIPNKTYNHPMNRMMDISFLETEIQNKIKRKKNIIYQGHLHEERDLTNFLIKMKGLQNFNIILLGDDKGMLDFYKKIYPDLIHISFVIPPLHLNVTSWADIGIITYDFKSLNTIYCAPNKIWEYTGFGIPILCNSNLGLKYSLLSHDFGKIIDFDNPDKIIKQLLLLLENYNYYSENALKFFNSFDLFKAIQLLVDED